ncbi:hypothetical protein AYO40_04925 [Planctomycetaceae bacterium SCGC AG-212-D15]|nr:hypothetical protein AYO40_04925 [Planctomycetaceae bacterium SCGC AG-212-D15]
MKTMIRSLICAAVVLATLCAYQPVARADETTDYINQIYQDQAQTTAYLDSMQQDQNYINQINQDVAQTLDYINQVNGTGQN